MKRNIITIDENKCTSCGLCVDACHEGALQLIDGKAKLISESYCDGLGDCLPECPTHAITIEAKEAADYDEKAVKKNMERKSVSKTSPIPCGCPGTRAHAIERGIPELPIKEARRQDSELRQWPCQIKLVPVNAPYFDNSHLLIAADCTAYAYANIHQDYMKNKITLIGCPKLDNIEYEEKLSQILEFNEIESITVLRMEVPCCGGIVNAVKKALINSGKMIPWNVVIIGTDGSIIEE